MIFDCISYERQVDFPAVRTTLEKDIDTTKDLVWESQPKRDQRVTSSLLVKSSIFADGGKGDSLSPAIPNNCGKEDALWGRWMLQL